MSFWEDNKAVRIYSLSVIDCPAGCSGPEAKSPARSPILSRKIQAAIMLFGNKTDGESDVSETTATLMVFRVAIIFVFIFSLTMIILTLLLKIQLSFVKTYLDCLYDVAGTLVFAFAAVGGLTAIGQLQETVKIRTSTVIIEIEARWSSKELENSRIKYQDLIREIEGTNEFIKNIPRDEQHNFYRLIRQFRLSGPFRWKIAVRLEELRNSIDINDHSRYHDIMALAGFFEYIGFLVKRRDLSARDINSLFGQSCIGYHDDIADHIDYIRKMDSGLAEVGGRADTGKLAYGNFSSLVEHLKRCSDA